MRLEGYKDGSFCFEACLLLIVSKHRTVVLVYSVGVFFWGGEYVTGRDVTQVK